MKHLNVTSVTAYASFNLRYRGVKQMSEDKENILLESIKEKVRYIRKHPAKVLLVPPLCAGYIMLLGAVYVNVLMYHSRAGSRPRDK